MRKAAPLFMVAAVGAALLGRCASNPNAPNVHVTRDRSAVGACVGLSRVTSESEGEAALMDLKRQTADLGGNVLLLVTERSGDAYYCANPPPVELVTPGPGIETRPTPRPRP